MASRRSFLRTAFRTGLASACAGVLPPWISAQSVPRAGGVPSTSVMLWTLAKYGSFEQRLEIVAHAGFRHVELVDEYYGWSDREFARTDATLGALDLSVDAIAGMKTGFANPSGAEAFLAELRATIAAAQRLRCPQIILLSGPMLEGVLANSQHAACVSTLTRAAALLAEANLTGVIEPIDRLEQPTIYLDGVSEAFAITRAVASPHVKVLFDLYHEQRSHGDLIEKLQGNIAEVGLIHVADVPGRHQPGTGEIAYGNIYRALGGLGYRGVVAMEFYPTADPAATLREAREALERDLRGTA